MWLLIIFKPRMLLPTRLGASKTGGNSQRQNQQQRPIDTTSELPLKGFGLELVVPDHPGALRSGYIDRRFRAPRFPEFVPSARQ